MSVSRVTGSILRLFFSFAFLSAVAASARASAGVGAITPANCSIRDFDDSSQLVEITAARAQFLDAKNPKKKAKAFVVKGDVLLSSKSSGGFRCASYGTAKGKFISGFIRGSDAREISRKELLTPSFLVGRWTAESMSIDIEAEGKDKVVATGSAVFGHGNNIHTGDFSGKQTVTNSDSVVFKEDADDQDACVVTLKRMGPYLMANDNSQCGGLNVRFFGALAKIQVRK